MNYQIFALQKYSIFTKQPKYFHEMDIYRYYFFNIGHKSVHISLKNSYPP